jgi:hypothetical protein
MIGFFMALGVYVFGLAALRRARRVEQVRATCRMIILTDAVAVVSILLLAAAGLSMALTTWNVRIGWIAVAIVSFILIAPIGPLIVERRLHTIERLAQATAEGPLSDALARRISDPAIGAALPVLIMLLLGIVFLMTTKPSSVAEAIVAMLIALAAGLTLGAPLWWRRSHPSQDAIAPQKD